MLKSFNHNWCRSERGQTMAEYVLVIATVALGSVFALGLVSIAIGGRYESIAASLIRFFT